PRVQRDGHERQGDVQDLGRLAIEPGAVVLTRRIPVVQLHHHLDALLLAHRAHAEQLTDVDQPHAANLHVVPRQLVTAPDEHVVSAARDRKSTRLNSSHGSISYAVFCLKKKTYS